MATLDYDAHWAANASSEPAPVPTRFSLKERLEGGSTSEADEQESIEPRGPAEGFGGAGADEPATSPYDYREGLATTSQESEAVSSQPSSQSAEAVTAVSAVSASASGAADFATFGGGASEATEPARSGLSAGSASSAGSVRRPIVRIPAAAQGVRTVNSSTGKLSSVQPVDSSPSAQDAVDVQEPYGVASIEEPMTQESVAIDVEAQAMMPSSLTQQDAEFGAPRCSAVEVAAPALPGGQLPGDDCDRDG